MEEQEFEQVTVKQVSMKWGAITAMIMIIYGLILHFAGLSGNQSLSYVNYLFLVVCIYLAQKSFKDEGDGFMGYGQGLGIGSLTTLIGGAISMVFSYLYVKFVDDSIIQIAMDTQYEKLVEKGMSEDQIDKVMDMSSAFMAPEVMFPIAFVFMMFIGFIISLIVSAITKNNNPAMEV